MAKKDTRTQLLTASPFKLMISLSLPAIIGMVVVGLYNFMDRIFVGQMIHSVAMGAEVLEEGEFDPFFIELEGSLSGKNIALFGSYGWGDGEWMRFWEERVNATGANLVCESVIANDAPNDEAIINCNALGKNAVGK